MGQDHIAHCHPLTAHGLSDAPTETARIDVGKHLGEHLGKHLGEHLGKHL
jgi:hypothetical protein